MKLKKLIDIASKVYTDGLIAEAAKGNDVGDTLATFIVRELKDTFNEDASDLRQLEDAMEAIGSAEDQLNTVFLELAKYAEDAERKSNRRASLYNKKIKK
jgi:hypothetical protein